MLQINSERVQQLFILEVCTSIFISTTRISFKNMIHSILALALLSTAAAFNNLRVASKTSNIVMMAEKSKSLPFMPQPANIVGMAGDVGFDPLGFSDFFDIRWLREAELKHARICMLAVTGFVASEFFQLPGEVHHVSPVAAHDAAVQSGAMSQILIWTGMFELLSTRVVSDMMDKENPTDRAPGDFMFDPLKFSEVGFVPRFLFIKLIISIQ